MRHWQGSMIVCLLIISTVGCSKEVIKKEVKIYNMESNKEGNIRAKSQGKGLNGPFLNEMKRSFEEQHILLTHEAYTVDPNGNIQYVYLINGNPENYISMYVFKNEQERMMRMEHLYGNNSVVATPTTRTEIYSLEGTALVYTSAGKDKGRYDEEVSHIFSTLLNRVNKVE
ncbi:hypothetical protein J2T13_005042 [Paenibacillus sp. DS2015]|uniref:hypothetical protein n=1 Tax=Paenibacillus sp. DS2015 TaxID=3373917 RepID=UPI003D19635B